MLQCYNVTMLQCYTVTLLHCYNVTMLQCYNVTLLQCYTVTMLQCYNVTMLQCYNVTMYGLEWGNRNIMQIWLEAVAQQRSQLVFLTPNLSDWYFSVYHDDKAIPPGHSVRPLSTKSYNDQNVPDTGGVLRLLLFCHHKVRNSSSLRKSIKLECQLLHSVIQLRTS